LLWPFPIFCGSGKPLGDGIYWPTNIKEEENYSSYNKQDSEKSGGEHKLGSATKGNAIGNDATL
jgi:hypothetical protein